MENPREHVLVDTPLSLVVARMEETYVNITMHHLRQAIYHLRQCEILGLDIHECRRLDDHWEW